MVKMGETYQIVDNNPYLVDIQHAKILSFLSIVDFLKKILFYYDQLNFIFFMLYQINSYY